MIKDYGMTVGPAVAVSLGWDHKAGKCLMLFDRPVQWVGMSSDDFRKVGGQMIAKANELDVMMKTIDVTANPEVIEVAAIEASPKAKAPVVPPASP